MKGEGWACPGQSWLKAREGEPSGIASVPRAGMGLTSRRGGAEAAAAVPWEALTFRTRDRNSSEDRPAWGRCRAGRAGPSRRKGRQPYRAFHVFSPSHIPPPGENRGPERRGKACNGQSWDGAKPSWSDSPRHHMACGTPPHAQVLRPSRGGVKFSAEPVLLAA